MIKKISKFFGIMAFLGWLSLAPQALAQNQPAFNNLPGDQEFLRGLNISRGQDAPTDPVEASGEEIVRGIIYYHNTAQGENGAPGFAAKNVKIKINLPTPQTTSHLITGQLSADNVAAVTGTFVNGIEIGQPGLTINTLAGLSSLEFITGSVKWFPEGATSPVTLPFNQSGDEILGAGVNLGDILGCWQFAGFVTFEVKVKGAAAGQPKIEREKQAFNETQNVAAQSVKAKADDFIRYTLITKNIGTAEGQTSITDDLADVLQYANLTENGGGTLNGSVLDFGSVTIAVGQTVEKSFKVRIKNPVPAEEDFVMTNVYGNEINVPVTPPEVGGEPILQVDKQVRNKTINTAFQNGASAAPGDTVEFRIIIRNRHGANPAVNVRIKDVLEEGLTFVSGSGRLEIAGTTRSFPIQIFNQDGFLITDPNPSLGPISQNDTLTIYFEAKVDEDVLDNIQLSNEALVSAKDHPEISDEVFVVIQIPTEEEEIEIPTAGPGPAVQVPEFEEEMVEPPITIPKTGPALGILMMLGLSSGLATGGYWLRSKKALKDALTQNRV